MSPAPRWPVVLFDFDGTLLNTIDGIVASYIYTWQTVSGRQVVRSEILPWIGRTLADVFADEDPANAAELEDVYLSHNAATLANAVRQYDGIAELAQELVDAGIRTGVVTSKRRRNVLTGMQLAGLPSEMVLACAMDDTDRHKPDPTPLLTGLAALDAPVEGSLYIGDAIYDLAGRRSCRHGRDRCHLGRWQPCRAARSAACRRRRHGLAVARSPDRLRRQGVTDLLQLGPKPSNRPVWIDLTPQVKKISHSHARTREKGWTRTTSRPPLSKRRTSPRPETARPASRTHLTAASFAAAAAAVARSAASAA